MCKGHFGNGWPWSVFFPPTNGNVGNAIRFVAGILICFATVQLHCVLSHCDSKGIVQQTTQLIYSAQFIMFIIKCNAV